MCLHGLDILSTWVLFFSLLCATASAFQYSHLAKDLDVFVTKLYGQSTVMFCRSERDACFWKLFVFFVPTTFFWYPWFIVEEFNSCVCFPFWSARKTYLEVCIVEHIVARSVSSPEFSLLSASVCVAPFFSNPCLQGWATICSFV